ncbi:MAG TPA: acyl-CoA thioesterase [Novosphingobium sp.]
MPKPDPALLDLTRYPYRTPIEPRFGDLDVNMHVNNVALIGLIEETRVRFHRDCGYGWRQQGFSAMIASLSIEFLGEAFYPGSLDVHIALAQIGRTSQTVCQLVTQKDRLIGFAQSVIVGVKDGQPSPLDEAYREDARQWLLRA